MFFKLKSLKLLAWLLLIAAIAFAILACSKSTESFWELCILSITAFIALLVYISSCETEEVKMFCKIREMLSSGINMEIHKALEHYKQEKIQIDNNQLDLLVQNTKVQTSLSIHSAEMYNYLGTLELCKIVLDHQMISKESFKKQFGYRIRNVVSQKQLVKLIKRDPNSWKDLISLIKTFDEYNELFQ